MADRVLIFDTTLRDGEQSPGCSMNIEEKLRMASQFETLGVDIIEAGFPIASEDDFLSVREIARSCRRATIAGLARAIPADIDRAWEALKEAETPRIHTFLATSDIHLQYKLKITREQALDQIEQAVREALPEGLRPGSELYSYGTTASVRDLARVVRGDRTRIELLVL
ncbi:MAG TPA: 2-isopropylmalate synthase, partial [Blastocatellia bacterium]|nr:2-isopropylmalate synthase [Blastocatellia bacterium]